jgi:hypothetical protein
MPLAGGGGWGARLRKPGRGAFGPPGGGCIGAAGAGGDGDRGGSTGPPPGAAAAGRGGIEPLTGESPGADLGTAC